MQDFKIKIIIIFGILSVGVIGAYFIISSSSGGVVDNKQQDTADNLSALDNNGSGVFDQNNSGNIVDSSGNNLSETNNLTEAFSKSFFNQVQAAGISASNPNSLKNSIASISSGMVNDLSNAGPQLKTVDDISDSNLKILSDNSSEAKTAYLKAVTDLIKKDFLDANPDNYAKVILDTYTKNDSASAVKSADIYKKLAVDFLNLGVPGDLISFHKELIVYYENSEIVYRAMADYSQDPIKGYGALDLLNNKLLNSGTQIQKDLAKIIINNGN